MDTEFNQTPSVRRFLPLIVILLVLGWGGLFLLMNTTQPNLGPRWMFFFLLVVGMTGLAMPGIVFLYKRFPSEASPDQRVIVRQSLWAGIYVALMIWLSLGQVFNYILALVVLAGIGVIEVFLRLRERSLWRRP